MKKLPNLDMVLPVLQPALGCFIKDIMGFKNSILPKIQSNTLVLCIKTNHFYKSLSLAVNYLRNLLRAINGVIAVEKPIPIDIATNIKLFPKETAANSAVPICPTIILSTKAH